MTALPLEYMAPKLPGYGDVDWYVFVSALSDIGYDGHTSIEVEDIAVEENIEDVEQSVKRTIAYMRRVIYQLKSEGIETLQM